MIKRKILLLLVVVLSFVYLPARDEDLWDSSLDKVGSMVSLIEENYFQKVDFEKLTYSSIRGVLETLDPHSYFLDPDSFSRMREDYTGKYYGLGIQIQKQEDRLVVISVIEGTPASRLGILPGDVIATIEGESTRPITSFDAMQKLRGPKGTKVTITIAREGFEKPLELTIAREEIPLHSVPYAFLLQGDVGYIFIRNFAGDTIDEFEEKMASLSQQGMKSLILDLRQNSGGPFFQSVELSDELLPKGALVVSIRGRNKNYDKQFSAERDGKYEKVPLVILIDQGTASASEIVAGAVMDNDRGFLVGEDSFGKGLVQTVFPLAPNMAVALTTAKYYTPSGRSIQRDYSSFEDWLLNKEIPKENREVKLTAKGRKVLGQGGISPDYVVKFTIKPLTYEMRLRGAFFTYARKFISHQTPLSKKYSFPQEQPAVGELSQGKILMTKDFVVTPEVVEDFKNYLLSLKIEFTPEKFAEAEEEIKKWIERELISAVWGIEEGWKVFSKTDPVVLKAIEIMPEAAKLVE
jgi:carboxyl-terminal processing protease